MISKEQLKQVKLVAFDFDGVFTDNRVITAQDGTESVTCWRSDGIGIARIIKLGIKVVIVSTETNPVVGARAAKLKIPSIQSVEDKAGAILEICFQHGILPENAMFVGNDINDIPAFLSIGIPIGVADSYPEIYPHILFKTEKPGGFGAVREICDILYNAQTADK
ncbi:N-acylneuraminate cytidylyltransferase/3-deoxy-D-manno-octulosonate 8-phosphate phosphatase (KDO 8-P phosphatase) [Daejeonella rubra]|uniref:N-acylneuraminate cytidylyltransferase/3-deoxy-D-manno-octulosonate 8-phosphate phosphatase (KDO 8-P phosphatase) n=1 Tax=Daejeonella rubra TaxID=990371 RepID=A0A1G9WVQ2_9SPHI|nr:3-deoxy-D-manno-octulosonate 8-phosphate phosphatase [Daejeonella rubra]SDM88236.1 N-acylneuraminate cytidylyltransferase/3-deoxy-D-manno-octulosonate 8-phosphate phosphatase (KDO 8-P phosphatase) [Daejeonella rubra]